MAGQPGDAAVPPEWPLAAHSRFVHAGGLRWHVQCLGSGPALVLVHGSGASSHTWRELAPLLAGQFSLVIPDLPGHGFSGALPDADLSLPGVARALGHLLQALQVTPVLAVGHSAGAAVLARLCLDGSLAPQQLISFNGALLPLSGLSSVWFAPVARMLAHSSLLAGLLAARARRPGVVQRLIDSTGSTLDAQGVAWYARLVSDPAHVAGVLRLMAHWDLDALRRDLPSLRTPLQLVVADNDRTVDPGQARRVAGLVAHCRVVHVAGLGPLAHEEAPAQFAQLILDAGAAAPAAAA